MIVAPAPGKVRKPSVWKRASICPPKRPFRQRKASAFGINLSALTKALPKSPSFASIKEAPSAEISRNRFPSRPRMPVLCPGANATKVRMRRATQVRRPSMKKSVEERRRKGRTNSVGMVSSLDNSLTMFEELRKTFGVDEMESDGVNSDKALLQREALRFSKKINAHIALLWVASVQGGKSKRMTRPQYMLLNKKLQIAVFGSYDPIKGYQMALDDWESDSKGKNFLDYQKFKLSWFQLVDLWTEEISEEVYCSFIAQLVQRLVKKGPGEGSVCLYGDEEIVESGERDLDEEEIVHVPEDPAEVFRIYASSQETNNRNCFSHHRKLSSISVLLRRRSSLLRRRSISSSNMPQTRIEEVSDAAIDARPQTNANQSTEPSHVDTEKDSRQRKISISGHTVVERSTAYRDISEPKNQRKNTRPRRDAEKLKRSESPDHNAQTTAAIRDRSSSPLVPWLEDNDVILEHVCSEVSSHEDRKQVQNNGVCPPKKIHSDSLQRSARTRSKGFKKLNHSRAFAKQKEAFDVKIPQSKKHTKKKPSTKVRIERIDRNNSEQINTGVFCAVQHGRSFANSAATIESSQLDSFCATHDAKCTFEASCLFDTGSEKKNAAISRPFSPVKVTRNRPYNMICPVPCEKKKNSSSSSIRNLPLVTRIAEASNLFPQRRPQSAPILESSAISLHRASRLSPLDRMNFILEGDRNDTDSKSKAGRVTKKRTHGFVDVSAMVRCSPLRTFRKFDAFRF